jgi:uncharacterized protein YjiS (DUF1127 family)
VRDFALNHARSFQAAGSSSIFHRLIQNWFARRSVSQLDRLDDYLLRDIGVTREDVRWASNLPLSMNAAAELDERATRRRGFPPALSARAPFDRQN